MDEDWLERLSDDEETELIEKFGQAVHKRSMETPAILFLEMHKPVAGLSSQAAIAFSPFVAPFVGIDNVSRFSRLLRHKESYERLIAHIEDLRDGLVEETDS